MIPKQIGRYQIKSELGRGGMAVVYCAFDPNISRDVAIKLLPREFASDPDFLLRFQREVKTIGSLENHAIVPIYDSGNVNGRQPYLVMRLMKGGSLQDILKRGPLSLTETVKIFNRLAPALDEAHAKGIVHRDLKPDNILLDEAGNLYLSDFGIVKLIESTSLTSRGTIGTPAYMSPEHFEGKISPQSDIYALGVMLFQMLTGQFPFRANTPPEWMKAHLLEPVPQIRRVNANLPPDLEAIIQHSMAKAPQSRYSTAKEMAYALNAVEQGLVQAELRPTKKYQAMKGVIPEPASSSWPVGSKMTKANFPWVWIGTAVAILVVVIIMVVASSVGGNSRSRVAGTGTTVSQQTEAEVTLPAAANTTVTATTTPTISPTKQVETATVSPATADIEGIVAAAVAATETVKAEAVQPTETSTETSTPEPATTPIPESTATPLPPTPTPTNMSIPPTPTSAVVGRIAFESDRDGNWEIYTMKIDGSKQTRLIRNPNVNTNIFYPTWSPDGKRIAFSSRTKGRYYGEVHIINDDGSEATFLAGQAVTPAWSPDMTRLAIAGGDAWPPYIYIITTDGGATKLTPGYGPSWSPDGQRLVFWAWDASSKADIFVINSNGDGLTQLTNTPFNEIYPAWSPDGRYIAFQSDGDGNGEIYVMYPDGSNATRLTTNSWGDSTPAWSPDSKQIAFASNRDGNWEIYVMNADGSEPKNLTNHPATDRKPAWSLK